MNRTQRLLVIRDLIINNKISSQEELLTLLTGKGYSYTQATLSRDLKFLKAGKVADEEKGHIYILPGEMQAIAREADQVEVPAGSIVSVAFSANMAVLKTLPGFAGGIALRIDELKAFEIIGTLAGDDTILVIARDGISRHELQKVLSPFTRGEERT